MKRDFAAAFEHTVAEEIAPFFSGVRCADTLWGAAVSGGPDSTALFTVLSRLAPRFNFRLEVITVDHNIRSPEESAGDARFTEILCGRFGIPCRIAVLEPGLVMRTAALRGRGVEESARFLRYQAFESFAAERGLSVLCLGHNRNDALETILQRFLQGSGVAGIAQQRGIFFRPLLHTPRSDIERYLEELGIPSRLDKTNTDETFLRNRLRGRLVPLLNELYPGWDGAVLRGAKTAALDSKALEELLPCGFWTMHGDICEGDALSFDAFPEALRLRLLRRGLALQQIPQRVPAGMLMEAAGGVCRVSGCGLEILRDRTKIIIKRGPAYRKRKGYFAILESRQGASRDRDLCVHTPAGTVRAVKDKPECGIYQGPFTLPVVIRSRLEADGVKMSGGGSKPLKKLFSGWKVPPEMRPLIPVIEKDGDILCVWGSAAGFPDWYVKDSIQTGCYPPGDEGSRAADSRIYLVLDFEVIDG